MLTQNLGGDKVFNLLLKDKQANEFEEQDLMVFNLTIKWFTSSER